MALTDQDRKNLQKIMSMPQWVGFEAYFKDFMDRNFVQSSVKRQTEFETIWNAAEQEGGKRVLQSFVDGLESEAKKV